VGAGEPWVKCHVRPASVERARWHVRLRRSATAPTMTRGFSGSASIDVGAVYPRVGDVSSFVHWAAAVTDLGLMVFDANGTLLNLV